MDIKRSTSFRKTMFLFILIGAVLFPFGAGHLPVVHAQDFDPLALGSSFSAEGVTRVTSGRSMIFVVDPNPTKQGIQVPAEPEVQAAIDAEVANPDAISSTFSITYQTAGTKDPAGSTCLAFPAAAQTAFNAAAAIWANTIQSSVPITISACWSNLGSTTILGYSGYLNVYRDFSGAPLANTWYTPALANALYGSDLNPSDFDDYTTLNSGFSWYTGTDGVVPAGKYDLVTSAAHEIGHSLNFSGSADYTSGTGSYGYGTIYPNVYDTFMESSGGTKLTAYTNPSTGLGSLLTSGSLWFNGTNANAANGGSRVRIYAPSTWASGLSYAHLDYSTFAGTINSMMVYAMGSGSANHNPGPVTTGLLKDLGWVLAANTPPSAFNKTSPSNVATNQPNNPSLKWGTSTGAISYDYCIDTTSNDTCDTSWISTGANTTVNLSGLALGAYSWQVRAKNGSGSVEADGGIWWSFTVGQIHKIYLPLVFRALPVPGSFNKTAPANDATGQPTNPTLSWGTSNNATDYEYCIDASNDSTCNGTGRWTSTIASTSIGLSGLNPTTHYYWQVRARNALGVVEADGGTWWSFTTSSPLPPGAFKKNSPANGAASVSTAPSLTWGTSNGATSYEYCIDPSNDNTCNGTGAWISTAASTSIGLSDLAGSTIYYWQVRSINILGTTEADGGTWWSFTTAEGLAGPSAGFWKTNYGDKFYVTPDQTNVTNIVIFVLQCGVHVLFYWDPVSIVDNKFSFSGSLYGSGTFDSVTSAHGIWGLSSYDLVGCGYVTGQWSWTATWQDSSQPVIVNVDEGPYSVTVLPFP